MNLELTLMLLWEGKRIKWDKVIMKGQHRRKPQRNRMNTDRQIGSLIR